MIHVCTWLPADQMERCGDTAEYVAVDAAGEVVGSNPPLTLCLVHVHDAQMSGLAVRWVTAVWDTGPGARPLGSYYDGVRDGLRRAAYMVGDELRIGCGPDRSISLADALATADRDQAAAEAALARFHDDRAQAVVPS